MATTYTWDCRTVDVHPTQGELSNVVYNVHWRLTGKRMVTVGETEEEFFYTNIGTQVLTLDTIQPEGFIPFDQLTHEQVIVWTEEAIGEERIEEIKTAIAEAIDRLITPVSVTKIVGEVPAPVLGSEEPAGEEPTGEESAAEEVVVTE